MRAIDAWRISSTVTPRLPCRCLSRPRNATSVPARPAMAQDPQLRDSVTLQVMEGVPLEPWTNARRLDRSSTMTRHRYADRFSIVRVETTGPLADAVRKSSSVPALLVSVFVRPVAPAGYQLWVDGTNVPTGSIPAFCANVIDFEAEPAM